MFIMDRNNIDNSEFTLRKKIFTNWKQLYLN